MKKTKMIIALLLVAVLCVSLFAACNKTQPAPSGTDTQPGKTEPVPSSNDTAPAVNFDEDPTDVIFYMFGCS